jgi:hypothetical protein
VYFLNIDNSAAESLPNSSNFTGIFETVKNSRCPASEENAMNTSFFVVLLLLIVEVFLWQVAVD